MKNIGIDFLPVENSPAGIGQYTLGIVKALLEIDKINHYYIYSTRPIDNFLDPKENLTNIIVKWPSKLPLKGIRWMHSVTRDLMHKKIDIMLSTSNNYFAMIFPKTIQFIHDLAPLYFPQNYKLNARILYANTSKLALEKALHVVTVSEQVKKELLKLKKIDPNKISVINAFMNEEIFKDQLPYPVSKLGESNTNFLNGNYILTISTLEPKKNMILGIKAFAKLIQLNNYKDYKYVIVGKKGWHFEEIFNVVKELKIEDKVIFLGYVEDRYIADIISKSKCMLMLSKYEGFGMPPLESLYFNIPVVVSDIPVFREILGNMATYVNIHDGYTDEDLEFIAGKIAQTIFAEKVDTKDQVIKMYNANRSAKELLALINQF